MADEHKPDYWFAVKLYGWGWGLPVRWQGWVVLALYFGSMYIAIRYFPPQNDFRFVWWLLISSAILVGIVVWKGERPLAWRWGKK